MWDWCVSASCSSLTSIRPTAIISFENELVIMNGATLMFASRKRSSLLPRRDRACYLGTRLLSQIRQFARANMNSPRQSTSNTLFTLSRYYVCSCVVLALPTIKIYQNATQNALCRQFYSSRFDSKEWDWYVCRKSVSVKKVYILPY